MEPEDFFDEEAGPCGLWRPGLFAPPRACAGDQAAEAGECGAGEPSGDQAAIQAIVAQLARAADGLEEVPGRLLFCRQKTASIYVDAAGRSLRFACRVIAADEVAEDDGAIDPRLLEWIS